jgi:regulator of cell morphogenesis and NO signaling
MNSPNTETLIGQWVADYPEMIDVLERHQIDYCCGGNRTLTAACQAAGVDVDAVLSECSQLSSRHDKAATEVDWSASTLTELCDHIEQTHHVYLRNALPRLAKLATKVQAAHGRDNPKLCELATTFGELFAELMPHMMKEEQVLFPAIRQLEESSQPMQFPFGTIQSPINMMEHEHDQAGAALRKLRELTHGYQIPEGACTTYRALLTGLAELETDLHEHIHKENNILFPRAAKLEASR